METTKKKKAGRPPKAKAPNESALMNAKVPTWAYKKGRKPVILKTPEEVMEYAVKGWSDKPGE